MSQDRTLTLAVLETLEGKPIAVNLMNVTYLRPHVDGEGVLIAFTGDDGVGVKGSFEEVLAKLTNA